MFSAGKSGGVMAPADPYFQDVTLLLTGDGTNGAQNNTFIDSSSNNFTITRNGNVTQGSFSPYGNFWSNYFDGSSYLQLASNSSFNMNTYCSFEAWVCYTSLGTSTLVCGRDSSYWIGYNFTAIGGTANKFVFTINNGSSWQAVSSTTTPTVGTWYHVVGVKDNTTLRIYINGVQENTSSFSGTAVTTSNVMGIASNQNTQNMAGYISNVRLVLGASSGVLPYTSNFTPSTTPLTAISGTSLLTCQSNRFIDNSSNNFALTVNGTPSVQRFSPFQPTSAYSTSVIGGSGYFDGSGDYLTNTTTSAGQLGNGDFTFECWYYTTSSLFGTGGSSNYAGIFFDSRSSAGDTSGICFLTNTSGYIDAYSGGLIFTSSNAIKAFSWNHIAFARSGTTVTCYINGVASGTFSSSANFSSGRLQISGPVDYSVGYLEIVGYLANPRIIKGTALYTSAFTPPTSPLTAVTNTSLLLNMTNAGIPDAAMMNDLETVGNAQVSTTVKKYGTGSLSFNGTTDYLSAPANPAFNLGTGDFTIELWQYWTGGTDKGICAVNGGSSVGINVFVGVTGYIRVYNGTGGSNIIDSTTAPTANTWQHIAVTRSSGTLRIFINGTQVGSGSWSGVNAGSATSTFSVGAAFGNARFFPGYIDDFRLTNGYARYTANFTPPTAALPTY